MAAVTGYPSIADIDAWIRDLTADLEEMALEWEADATTRALTAASELRDLAARSVQAAAAYRGAIRDLHEAGMSYAQIGAALGISRGTVQKHMEWGR